MKVVVINVPLQGRCILYKTIALMLATESYDHAYSLQAYQNEELKSLTRYRFDKVNQRFKLKQSLSRLVTITSLPKS